MNNRKRYLGWVLCVALTGGVAHGQSSPDKRAKAQQHYQVGAGFFRAHEYEAAVREFAAGYALMPRPEFLLNMGAAYRQMKSPVEALRMYERFLEAAPDSPRRAEVSEVIAELRPEAERELKAREAAAAEPASVPAGLQSVTRPPVREERNLGLETGAAMSRPVRAPRAKVITGATLIAVGIAGLAAGAGSIGAALDLHNRLFANDGAAWNLADQDRRDRMYVAGWVVGGIGVAALVTGAVVTGLGRREQKRFAVQLEGGPKQATAGLMGRF
jgi:hypothetical protein